MPYRFLPEVALADVAFESSSPTLGGLFEESAKALTEVMVDPRSLRLRATRSIEMTSQDIDRLLYDFLTELIVIKDVDSLLWKRFDVRVDRARCSLTCTMKGEAIDRSRHRLRNDAKAVTMHLFGVRRSGRRWVATVVLDI